MNKLFSQISFLFVLIALFAFITVFTKSFNVFFQLNLVFFSFAALSYILSIIFWIISWSFLIKKNNIKFKEVFLIGLKAHYASLTPVQIGTETIRMIELKKRFKLSFSKSISAAMVSKGLKFLVIAISAIFLITYFLRFPMPINLFLSLISGLIVILLAVFFFLLPLNKYFAIAVINIFSSTSKIIPLLKRVSKFFVFYSNYLKKLRLKDFVIVFTLVLISWLFEFLAMFFVFFSLNLSISFYFIFILLILVAVLERTPFIPRGIGLVELISYFYLSINVFSLSVQEIGAIIIAFDVVRLIIPFLFSIAINILLNVKRL